MSSAKVVIAGLTISAMTSARPLASDNVDIEPMVGFMDKFLVELIASNSQSSACVIGPAPFRLSPDAATSAGSESLRISGPADPVLTSTEHEGRA
jgi:hypothetical protein